MPTGIAAARTPRESKRRSRTAVGATAGRIHRAGTSRNTGHWRRAQATIRSSSRLSIGALSPLSIARGYAWAPSTAIMQAPAHDRAHRAIVSEPAPLPLPPDSDTLGSHPRHLRIGRRPRAQPSREQTPPSPWNRHSRRAVADAPDPQLTDWPSTPKATRASASRHAGGPDADPGPPYRAHPRRRGS
jgi:hypothetical protein